MKPESFPAYAGTSSTAEDTSVLVEGIFLCQANFLFGLEPIVQLGARFVASLDVEFVGSSPNPFFKGERLDCGSLCAGRCWHAGSPPAITPPHTVCERKRPLGDSTVVSLRLPIAKNPPEAADPSIRSSLLHVLHPECPSYPPSLQRARIL